MFYLIDSIDFCEYTFILTLTCFKQVGTVQQKTAQVITGDGVMMRCETQLYKNITTELVLCKQFVSRRFWIGLKMNNIVTSL